MDDHRTLAEQALDDVDAATLRQVRALYDSVDPVPDDLVGRITFSVALGEVFDEVARLTRVPLDALAVRSAGPTRTETLTFSADRLTAMVTVNRVAVGRLRLDGWLTPADGQRVRLRIQDGGTHETIVDEQGRFSFDRLLEGFGQLSFHPGGATEKGEAASTVVTPLFQL